MSRTEASDNNLLQSLTAIESEALKQIAQVPSLASVEELRVHYLGKKGKLSAVLAGLGSLDVDARKQIGERANQLKVKLENELKDKAERFTIIELERKLAEDQLDTTAPGVTFTRGHAHPIRSVLREAVQIFERAGLKPAYGPEVEYEDLCFDALNFKPGHPARDMQATFFVKTRLERSLVLRTHTSPVQVRLLREAAELGFALPLRVQVPGRVYRCDDDMTHAPMFHQIEGLAVDRSSTLGDLRAVLDFFFRNFFDSSVKIRFRPSFFPFTEPSAEVDVSCVFCKGRGCRVCKTSGWLEVAGAGLVHPEVFRASGWDPLKVQGWAFGLGVERLAMLKLGIPDLRLFFENRLSFLRGRSS